MVGTIVLPAFLAFFVVFIFFEIFPYMPVLFDGMEMGMSITLVGKPTK